MSFKKHFHGGININMVMAMMAMAMEMAIVSSSATGKTGRTRPPQVSPKSTFQFVQIRGGVFRS